MTCRLRLHGFPCWLASQVILDKNPSLKTVVNKVRQAAGACCSSHSLKLQLVAQTASHH